MNPLEFTVQWISDFGAQQKRNFLAKALRSERRQRDHAQLNPERAEGAVFARQHQRNAIEILEYVRLNAPSK